MREPVRRAPRHLSRVRGCVIKCIGGTLGRSSDRFYAKEMVLINVDVSVVVSRRSFLRVARDNVSTEARWPGTPSEKGKTARAFFAPALITGTGTLTNDESIIRDESRGLRNGRVCFELFSPARGFSPVQSHSSSLIGAALSADYLRCHRGGRAERYRRRRFPGKLRLSSRLDRAPSPAIFYIGDTVRLLNQRLCGHTMTTP